MNAMKTYFFLALIFKVCLMNAFQLKNENQQRESNNEIIQKADNFTPDSGDNTIFFDMPDLTVQYVHQNVVYQLEAYKSSGNDKILNENDKSKFNQLLWVSLGHPLLIKTTFKSDNSPQLFHFSQERFYTYVSMLQEEHTQIFADLVAKKYNVSVSPKQIVLLPIGQFDCKLKMVSDEGKKIIMNAEATDFKTTPIQLDFWIPAQVINIINLEYTLK